ncbi:MAG: ATP-binding protein [bacterium]
MNFYPLPSLISVIGNLFLGAFVYVKGKKSQVHKSFALLCLILAFFSLNTYLKLVTQRAESAYLYNYILSTGIILIPFALHYFSFHITKINTLKEKIALILNGISTLFFLGINLSSPHLLVTKMIQKPFGYVAVNGYLYQVYLLGAFSFIFYAIYLVTLKYKTTKSPTEKNQMYCLLISFGIGSLNIISFIFSTLGYNYYSPTGNIANLLALAITAFAILRRGTISTLVIFEQSFLYLLLSVFIIVTYIVVVGLSYLLFIKTLPEISIFVTILVAIIISYLFQPLKEKFSYFSKKIFFKIDYDAPEFLLGFNQKLSNIFELSKLLSITTKEISETLRCSHCFILLYNEESKLFETKASLNNKDKNLIFKEDNCIVRYLSQKDTLLIREDLDIWSSQDLSVHFSKEELLVIMNELRKCKVAICIPLSSMERMFGILCLGDKIRSIYTPLDLYVLKSIKEQISISTKNLMLLEEMKKMKENLYQADKLATIGTLVSEIAHEIRNPLVSISVFAQLIKEKIEDKNFQEKIKSILPNEVKKLNSFLDKLLNFSRASEFQYQKVEIGKIIEELLLLLEETFIKHYLTLVKDYSIKEAYVLGESSQLRQVFMNIVINAVQAMPQGGQLRVSLSQEERFLSLKISDTGGGIPEGNLSKIFEPFYTTKEKGTGLGLSICKRIIREHQGEIKVTSEVNQGTTFEIQLPLVI